MINQTLFGTTKKMLIAILFGILTLLASPYGISSVIGDIQIDIPWSLFMPLVISIAFGWRYGIICGLSGGALFPFLLWPNNGYANIGTALIFIIIYILVGMATDAKIWKKNQNLLIRVAMAIVISIAMLSLFDSFFFNKLLALGPPFWTNETLNYLPQQLLYTFAIKDSINLVVLIFISETFVRIPIILKLLGVPPQQIMADNSKIMIITTFTAIMIWVSFLGLDHLLFESVNILNDHHAILAFIVIVTSGFFVARMLFNYSETQYENQSSLRDSESLYRLLTDNSTDMIARHDIQGRFLYVSPACNPILGYNQEDLIGHEVNEFIHPEDVLRVTQSLEEIAKQPIFTSTEFRMLCKTGKYIWFETTSHFIRDIKTDKLMEIHSSSRDITARKQTDLSLLESKANLTAIIENTLDSIWSIDKNYEITYINAIFQQAFLSRFGILLTTGMNILSSLPETIRPLWKSRYDRAFSNEQFVFEDTVILESTTLYHEVAMNPILIQNKVVGASLFSKDITARRQAEEKLKESEGKFKALYENANDAIFLLKDGQFFDCNPTTLKIFDCTLDEIIGKAPADFSPRYQPDGEPSVTKALKLINLATKGQSQKYDWQHTQKNGTLFEAEVLLNSVVINKKLLLQAIVRDITERKKSEELLRESENRYKTITAGITDYLYTVIVKDGKAVKTIHGEACLGITGYSAQELTKDAFLWFNMIFDADKDEARAKFSSILTGKTTEPFEHRIVCKDGSIRWLSNTIIPKYDSLGAMISYDGVIKDITERKVAEEKLKDSEVMFSDLASNVPGVIYQFFARKDGSTGFYYLGPKVKEVLGMSPDKSSSEWDLGTLVHPNDKADFFKAIATAISEVKELHYEGRLITTKGVVWIQILSRPMVKNDEIIFNGIILNITERKATEEQLRESQRVLLESQAVGHIGAYITDLKTSQWQSTAELEKIFGIYQHENYPHTLEGWVGFIHPDSREELFAYHQEVVEQRKRFEHEYQIIRINDGEHRWVQGTGELEYDSNNQPIKMLGVIQDITERKQAEDALKSLATSYANLSGKTFFEAVTKHIAEAMKLDYVFVGKLAPNRQGVNVLGGTAHGSPMGDMSYDLINTPCNSVINDKACFYPSGIQMLFPDDELLIQMGVDAYLGAPLLGKNNEPLGILVALNAKPVLNTTTISDYFNFFIDRISAELQRLEASEELRKSEAKLSALFGSMAEMVILHELVFNEKNEVVNYRITDCNYAYTEVTGIQKEDAVGKLATELYQTDVPPYLEDYANVAITGLPFEHNNYFTPLDKHFMISVVSPSKNTFATITTDITSMRQIQEAILAKNQELENYLYVTSHDLRSPLVNIQGFSQRLQKHANAINNEIAKCPLQLEEKSIIEKLTHENIPKTLEFIFTNVAKMDTLINGLLQISRTGRIKMYIKHVDANNLFQTIISALNYQITELGVTVKIDNLTNCYGDEALLNQLFSNIIGNAIKYRDKNRKLVIEITSLIQFKRVIYSIKDNGIGISQRHLEKIWDVFYRVDPAAPESGEGIGLSLVKRIADKHKGKIWAQSEEGIGTTFFVALQRNDFTE